MAAPVLFDGQNLFDPEKMARLGFDYWSIGRPRVDGEQAAQ
jgi:UDPglucose 6-dehydrogenase